MVPAGKQPNSRSMHWNVTKRKSCFMCHVLTCVSPLPLHESERFTSCKMSAHVIGHQYPRTESHKEPFGGQMVSTKGMWLSNGFPLESKCYQSCESITGKGMLWLFIVV